MRDQTSIKMLDNRWFTLRIAVLAAAFLVFNAAAGNLYFIIKGSIYPTVHNIIEFASIIAAMSVSVMSWYEHRNRGDLRSLILSAVFCMVGLLDMAHSLAYLGMPDFIGANSVNKASTYWIIARIVQSVGILIAVCAGVRPYRGRGTGLVLLASAGAAAAAVYYTAVWINWLPPMYDTALKVQTPLKIALEYMVMAVMSAAAVIILKKGQKNRSDFLLAAALIAGVMSEMAFTSYSNAYDVYNLLGHAYKIVSFSFILKALVDEGLAVVYQANRELAVKSEELAEMNRQLTIADGLKNDFLANTNHELRTPLSAVVAFTELLLDEVNTGRLNDLQRDYLKEINDSSRELMGRIKGLLELSGILGGKIVLHKENILLAEAVAATVSAHEESFREKGVRLEAIYGGKAEIYVDREKIARILANLLDNALKFTDSGGSVTVTAGIEPVRQKAFISVCDTGVGIEPRHCDSVFEMFYQADGTSTRKYGGTGIGLTLAVRLAEMNGGTIELESECGKGSKFTLVLPLFKEVQ
ncbi:MAG: ATP-binding protein [Firmicutes bacterium]|nr:ATP-binding protein [Bacillota bacterium]MCL5058470.1 ATP-binding protein [Actinomycetota bacterium]